MVATQCELVKAPKRFVSTLGDDDQPVALRPESKQEEESDAYKRAIQDLNLLQSNSQVIALAKYKNPEAILPLFRRQLQLAGLEVAQLNRLNVIHVSGTKGKGSTCAFAESILRRAGLRTGFYNSPHLIKVTERIQLNGKPISEHLFATYFRQIFDRLMEATTKRGEQISMPSYFSFLTILAFHIFLEQRVDCAIIEVGMGGEYDPTNVIERPLACGITTLDFDHTNVLGSTMEQIAWNKAGIIKPGAPVFTVRHEQREVARVIEERAHSKGAQLSVCEPLACTPNLNLGIPSSAQYANAALACRLANCVLAKQPSNKQTASWNPDNQRLPETFRLALEQCRWPGRCQIVQLNQRVSFFLDGAHTRKSMENCLEWFKASSKLRQNNARQLLMANVIGERDKLEVLRPLANYEPFEQVIFSTNRINLAGDTPKSETFVNLQGSSSEKSLENVKNNAKVWAELRGQQCANVLLKANTHEAIKAVEQLQEGERPCHVLATGSLHFVGAILETLATMRDRHE